MTDGHLDPWRMFDGNAEADAPHVYTKIKLTVIGSVGRICVQETEQHTGVPGVVDLLLNTLTDACQLKDIDGFRIIEKSTKTDPRIPVFRVDGDAHSVVLPGVDDRIAGFNRLFTLVHRIHITNPGALEQAGISLEA